MQGAGLLWLVVALGHRGIFGFYVSHSRLAQPRRAELWPRLDGLKAMSRDDEIETDSSGGEQAVDFTVFRGSLLQGATRLRSTATSFSGAVVQDGRL